MDGGAWQAPPWGRKESNTTEQLHFILQGRFFFTLLLSTCLCFFFFFWTIIALQYCVSFCCMTGEGNGTHSSILVWKIPWTEEPGGLQSMGSRRVGHNCEISLSLFTFMHWRRKWQPTPVFLPGESQGRGNLVGYSPQCQRVGHDSVTEHACSHTCT